MRKFLFTVIIVFISNILPLAAMPALILHYKMIIILIAACSLWLTQPLFTFKETTDNKNTDRFSVLLILTASFISIVWAEVEWAYMHKALFENNILTITGAIMMITGIALRVWAISTLGNHFTVTARLNQQHKVITNGPYALLRHPSYSGAFLAITGSAFFLNAPYAIFISIIVMSVAYYFRIKSEEKMLVNHFGDEYADYATNKKKIIPFIW